MGFKIESSGIAGSVFLALYAVLLPLTIYCSVKKGFKSLFLLLLLFNVIRLAGQICAFLLGYYGIENEGYLVGYIIFSAEGYFVLILASLYTIVHGQILVKGESWIKDYGPRGRYNHENKRWYRIKTHWYGIYHLLLIPANALLVVGGAITSGLDLEDFLQNVPEVEMSKSLRCAGQVLFLFLTIVMTVIAIHTYFFQKVKCYTLIAVLTACPLLLIRGVFGILSIYIDDMNYMAMSNYLNGFHSTLIIYEYILGTSMEFVSAIFLVSAYFDKQREPELSREDLFETICKNEY